VLVLECPPATQYSELSTLRYIFSCYVKCFIYLYRQPFWSKTYDDISKHFENVIEQVCARVMDENLKHEMVLSHINKLGTIDCTIGTLQNIAASYDMTWTKRGYHSPQVSE